MSLPTHFIQVRDEDSVAIGCKHGCLCLHNICDAPPFLNEQTNKQVLHDTEVHNIIKWEETLRQDVFSVYLGHRKLDNLWMKQGMNLSFVQR